MSLKQSKSIQAIAIICIIIHHISLKLCDPHTVPAEYIKHGPEPFMYIGYLAVAVFFFCSGYGLYRSIHSKEGYLTDFFFNRLTPIITAHLLVIFLYMYISNRLDIPIQFQVPTTIFGPNTINPYSWYIYAIILCYFLFYVAFKYCKNERLSIGIICAGLVMYIAFCNYWLYGGWWYNTILVFPFGLIYARNEVSVRKKIEANYKHTLVGISVLAVVGFAVAEILSNPHVGADELMLYSKIQLIIAMLRTLTSCFFVLLLVMISMKKEIDSVCLSFWGELTLEIYLLHGVFVQIFASEYLAGYDISVCYIHNPFLYTVLVMILSVGAAFLLHKIVGLIFLFIKKELKGLYGKAVLVSILLIIGLMVVITIKTYKEDQKITSERTGDFAQFASEQNYVQVGDGRMAYYTEGSGEHTILIMGSIYDPSSELVMRCMTKFLSKENRVLVFDYLGRGFSDDAKTPRTADNIAHEMHEALLALNMDDKYILMPCDYSGTYALKYIELYPDEVEGVIGVDMMLPAQYDLMVSSSGLGENAYIEAMNKAYNQQDRWRKFEAKTGYSRWMFHVYEPLWVSYSLKDYIDMTEELYVKSIHRGTAIEEQRMFGENCSLTAIDKLPENIPALLIVDYVSAKMKVRKTKYIDTYYDFISNADTQRVRIIQGDPMFFYYQGSYFNQVINEFIHENYTGR